MSCQFRSLLCHVMCQVISDHVLCYMSSRKSKLSEIRAVIYFDHTMTYCGKSEHVMSHGKLCHCYVISCVMSYPIISCHMSCHVSCNLSCHVSCYVISCVMSEVRAVGN